MLNIGDYIVHENSGICRVEDITQLKMPGAQKNRMYYVLLPVYSKGSKVYTPVDNDKVIMRQVVTVDEAKTILSEIPHMELMQADEFQQGEGFYKEALRSCNCWTWAKMVKSLYKRCMQRTQQGKKPASSDERYLKLAQDYLCQELAMVLETTENEVKKYIIEQLK